MKLTGRHHLPAPRQQVWTALHDPAVLARTLPGCESVERTGPGTYAATLTAGVASVRGTYRGTVTVADRDEPTSYRLVVSGAGTPGTVQAEGVVTLADDGSGTTIVYEADAVVAGTLGCVGQRMLVGMADRTVTGFFAAVERELSGVSPALPRPAEGSGAASLVEPALPTGQADGDARTAQLVAAGVVGAVLAIVAGAIRRRVGRRRAEDGS